MRIKRVACIGLLLLFLLFNQSSTYVMADVPAILEISREKEGGDTVLVIQVRHRSPSSSHYVDIIEIEVGDKLEKLSDLEPQSSTQFSEKYVIEANVKNIKVRAHCNIHGWSSWVTGENEEPTVRRGITGFPYESIILGIASGIFVLFILSRKS